MYGIGKEELQALLSAIGKSIPPEFYDAPRLPRYTRNWGAQLSHGTAGLDVDATFTPPADIGQCLITETDVTGPSETMVSQASGFRGLVLTVPLPSTVSQVTAAAALKVAVEGCLKSLVPA